VLIRPETVTDLEDYDPTVLEVVDAHMQPLGTRPPDNMAVMQVLYNGKFAVSLTYTTPFGDAVRLLAGGWFAPGVRKLLVPARLWSEFKRNVPTKRGVKGRGFAYYFDENDYRHRPKTAQTAS
jgi:hypothetical protein